MQSCQHNTQQHLRCRNTCRALKEEGLDRHKPEPLFPINGFPQFLMPMLLHGDARQQQKISSVLFQSYSEKQERPSELCKPLLSNMMTANQPSIPVPLVQIFSAKMLVQCKHGACTPLQANPSFGTAVQPFLVLGHPLLPLPLIFPLSIHPSNNSHVNLSKLTKRYKIQNTASTRTT